MKSIIAAAVLAAIWGGTANAGVIERACLKSDRSAASRSLCGCIQQVADLTLGWRDQRQAAKFFRDPDRAQKVRQSDRRSDSAFWQRYKQVGATAENYCS